ncbi:MAG: PIN domain-containing protein [bacterium]
MKIYLDVCCFNRPYDDQRQDRIHLESEAVLRILDYCQMGKWHLIGSEVIDFEIFKISDGERKQKVAGLASMAKVQVIINAKIEKQADILEKAGFKSMDALHLACAEYAKADILLTTDDKFYQNILKNSKLVKIRVNNPLNWLMEVMRNEYTNFKS